MNIKKYIAELKRRHVFKAGIAYLVVAWLIAQIASIVLPTFEVPPFVMKTLLFILIIGFPINLVFAWIYDVTPEGIKKTKSLENKNKNSDLKSGRLNKVIIASLSLAVIILLFNQFGNNSSGNVADTDSHEISTKFIGVLPFSNTKPDLETDYFGFAIADQIIGDLVYLKNIIVRPSSSIRKYEKEIVDSKTAGDELNVDYILTGNFLMEGNIIRMNVELVEVSTNEIKWRDRIEVDFESAFELQDIIAKHVVKGMNTQFSEKEINRIGKDLSSNPLAYEYYLRGVSYPHTNEGDEMAIEMFNKSIELDSIYAPAYDNLGTRIHNLAQYGLLDPEETKKAETAYIKALSINEELLSALGHLAKIYTETARTEKAVELTKQMLEINPNNADAHFALGYIYRYAGMNTYAIQEMEKAIAIDPMNPGFQSIGITYMWAGEYEKAFEVLKNYAPSARTYFGIQGLALFREGKKEQAIKYFERVIELEPEGLSALMVAATRAYIEDEIEEGIAIASKFEQYDVEDAEAWYLNAGNYGLLGDRDGCIRCLQRAVDGGFFNYPLIQTDFFLDSVRDEPEFHKIQESAKQKHNAFKKMFF